MLLTVYSTAKDASSGKIGLKHFICNQGQEPALQQNKNVDGSSQKVLQWEASQNLNSYHG